MVEKVLFNDYEIEAGILDIKDKTNEPTGNILKQIELECEIIGKTKRGEIGGILKNVFVLKIPSQNIEIKAKSKTNSWSYQGYNLDENTSIKYNMEIEELDKDLPDDWNAFYALAGTTVDNWIRTRALSELLEEKGVSNLEEYEKKIELIQKRDRQKLVDWITHGKNEKKDKIE